MAEKLTYAALEQRALALEKTAIAHKRAEEALQKRQELFQIIFKGSRDAVFITGQDARFACVNPAACKLTGYSEEELLTMCIADLHEREDLDAYETFFDRIMNGEDLISEAAILRKDGSKVPTEFSNTRVTINGRYYMHSVARDITERKMAQKALAESEAFTRAVMDHLPIGIAVNSVNPVVEFSYMNDNFPKIYRTTREALADPDKFWEVVYEDPVFREKLRNRVMEDCASGDPKRMYWEDVPFTRKGEGPYFICARNISLKGKQVMISTVWDVTDRKRVEKALRESEEKFRNIAENSLVGVYIIQDGVFVYVNTKFAEIFGYSVAECLNNMHFRQTVHPEDISVVQAQINKRVSGKVNATNYTFRGIKKDGSAIHVEVFGSSILLDGKTSVTGSLLDITERNRVEKDRDMLIAELQKALSEVKTLQGFLPICSHCKKIRDDKGYWSQIESYIQKHSETEFSHGICPECAEKFYPESDIYDENEIEK